MIRVTVAYKIIDRLNWDASSKDSSVNTYPHEDDTWHELYGCKEPDKHQRNEEHSRTGGHAIWTTVAFRIA